MHRPHEGNLLTAHTMAFEPPKRQPHEILGVAPDADLITLAFNRLAPRCNPQFHPGDEVAAMRFRRLREAYDTMSAAQGFRATPDPLLDNGDFFDFGPPPRQTAFNYQPAGRHSEYARAAELIEERRKKQTPGERARELLNRRVRINRLCQDWADYSRAVNRRHQTVDALKAERGLSMTFLKSILRRTDEDKAVWNAESYLRHGIEESTGLHYSYRNLSTVINELRHRLRANELEYIASYAIDMAEDDLRDRRIMFQQALGIIQGKKPAPGPT